MLKKLLNLTNTETFAHLFIAQLVGAVIGIIFGRLEEGLQASSLSVLLVLLSVVFFTSLALAAFFTYRPRSSGNSHLD